MLSPGAPATCGGNIWIPTWLLSCPFKGETKAGVQQQPWLRKVSPPNLHWEQPPLTSPRFLLYGCSRTGEFFLFKQSSIKSISWSFVVFPLPIVWKKKKSISFNDDVILRIETSHFLSPYTSFIWNKKALKILGNYLIKVLRLLWTCIPQSLYCGKIYIIQNLAFYPFKGAVQWHYEHRCVTIIMCISRVYHTFSFIEFYCRITAYLFLVYSIMMQHLYIYIGK